MNAGFINSVYLGTAYNFTVSHVTGLFTRSAIGASQSNWELLLQAWGAIFCFIIGAMVGSGIVGEVSFKPVRNYGYALVVESFLLFIPVLIPTDTFYERLASSYIACIACGLQNAMITTYSSAIVRTTHMTGTATDIGVVIGRYIRNVIVGKKDRRGGLWRLKVLIPLACGYFLGGVLGGVAFQYIPIPYTLLIPATATGWVGFIYIIIRSGYVVRLQKKEMREKETTRRQALLLQRLNNLAKKNPEKSDEPSTSKDLSSQIALTTMSPSHSQMLYTTSSPHTLSPSHSDHPTHPSNQSQQAPTTTSPPPPIGPPYNLSTQAITAVDSRDEIPIEIDVNYPKKVKKPKKPRDSDSDVEMALTLQGEYDDQESDFEESKKMP